MFGPADVEDDAQFVVADRDDGAADLRIEHDAALEISARRFRRGTSLAQQVDAAGRGRDALALGGLVERDIAQRADDQRTAVPDAEERADGDVRIAVAARRHVGRKLHDDLRAADRHDAPERRRCSRVI